ncbi:vacuolar protein sorting-associated protein 51 homolog [Argiope bruennichi]|uniref:vacuolar protein sorting-associated protein 51 homolog n=1 Tax=Argiope bruennichi TaxID=94029 RepID=UPI002494E3F3|nr:vacuolar protein sorting-associated protein 51 homolog [Argiope bruennichi]
MDREEFNPDLCMLRITEDCNLQQIVSKKNHLDMEIRSIAGGIQNMLYDNYTKFLIASEVISKIKNDFERMEKDVNSLESEMNSIGNLSSRIVQSLQPTKNKKLRLIKSKESNERLAILVDLIPNLKEYIEQGGFAAAAKHYLKAKHLLEQHKNLTSLKGIIKESLDIAFYIQEKLRDKLDCCVYSKEEIIEIMNLILDLGKAENEVLQDFLFISRNNLTCVIQKIRTNCFCSIGGDGCATNAEIDRCSDYSCTYIDTLSKIVEIVQGVFSAKPTTLHWSSILTDFVEDNTQQLFLLARAAFKNQFSNMNDECLANCMDHLYRKIYECNIHVPKIATFEKSADVILDICIDRCDYHLHRMKQDFRSCLRSLKEKLSSEHTSDDLLALMDTTVREILANSLHSLCYFISPEHKFSRNVYFRKKFCKSLARERVFVPFLLDMNDDILRNIYTSRMSDDISLKMCMLFAKYVLQLHQKQVHNFLNFVDVRLHSSTENITLTSASDIVNKYKKTAEKIISHYIEVRQSRMSSMFRHSMESKNWSMTREPWKVSAVVRRALEDFYATVKETETLVEFTTSAACDRGSESGKSTYRSSLSRTSSPVSSSADDRIMIRIHKLFPKPSAVSEAAEFSNYYILHCIMKMTLKSLLEYARQRTFSRFGLQQVQVDVQCLRLHVSQYLKNELDIETLFDDIISNCYSRAIDPEFMNPYVVSSLCQAFLI